MDQTLAKNLPLTPPLLSLFQMILHSVAVQKFAPKVSNVFNEEYDYIIVGAGSAGATLAGHLSEKSCVTVLLIEAGLSSPAVSEVPAFGQALLASSNFNWQFKTVPQMYSSSAIQNREVPLPSGKGLGGGSLINAVISVRGNHHNYNEWARMGATGWSYEDVLPYFKKLENNTDKSFVEDGYHGVSGPVTISQPSYNPEVKKLLKKAIISEGYKFVDPNGARQIGFYDIQAALRNGQRCSTAKAYLVPSENRTNLDILPNATVTKIDIKNKVAVGVYFQFNGTKQYVKAKREVILSAGAHNTPKLLMLSGVGPSEELKKFKIPVVSDLQVGQNLHDQYNGLLFYEVEDDISIQSDIYNKTSFEHYLKNRKGPLTSLYGFLLFAFLTSNKIEEANDIPKYQITFAKFSADFLLGFGIKQQIYNDIFSSYANKSLVVCTSESSKPKSTGYVKLASSNPFDPPIINHNYFENSEDSKAVVEGFKTCVKLMEHPALSSLKPKMIKLSYPGCEKFTEKTDMYYDCIARAFPLPSYHFSGTSKMGSIEDSTTVLDPELKVKGVKGLRVVDASIIPTPIWGNTMIPAIMIGEKAADIIKKSIKC